MEQSIYKEVMYRIMKSALDDLSYSITDDEVIYHDMVSPRVMGGVPQKGGVTQQHKRQRSKGYMPEF